MRLYITPVEVPFTKCLLNNKTSPLRMGPISLPFSPGGPREIRPSYTSSHSLISCIEGQNPEAELATRPLNTQLLGPDLRLTFPPWLLTPTDPRKHPVHPRPTVRAATIGGPSSPPYPGDCIAPVAMTTVATIVIRCYRTITLLVHQRRWGVARWGRIMLYQWDSLEDRPLLLDLNQGWICDASVSSHRHLL